MQPGFIVTVSNVFTSRECDILIDAIERAGLNPLSYSDLHPRKNEAYLNREALSLTDAEFSALLFEVGLSIP